MANTRIFNKNPAISLFYKQTLYPHGLLMKIKPFRNTPLDERKEKNNTRVRVYL
jgi:hypothetical protein